MAIWAWRWPCGSVRPAAAGPGAAGRGGLEILRAVRATRPTQPVIILTARGEEQDRVEGLRAGADDYVVKPFSVKELLARVEAVLRRSPGPADGRGRGRAFPAAWPISPAASCALPTASGCELSERRGGAAALPGHARRAGPSPATSCWPTSGGSAPTACRRARSTCTSPACAKSSATTPTEPQVLLTVRGKGYMFQECQQVQ